MRKHRDKHSKFDIVITCSLPITLSHLQINICSNKNKKLSNNIVITPSHFLEHEKEKAQLMKSSIWSDERQQRVAEMIKQQKAHKSSQAWQTFGAYINS